MVCCLLLLFVIRSNSIVMSIEEVLSLTGTCLVGFLGLFLALPTYLPPLRFNCDIVHPPLLCPEITILTNMSRST